MFTSRAEHRLLLRIDNADLRLTPRGRSIGLVDDERWARFEARRERYRRNLETLEGTRVRNGRGESVSAAQMLRQPEIRLESLIRTGRLDMTLDPSALEFDLASVETSVKYAGYLRQEAAQAERSRREERRAIPGAIIFGQVPGLSREVAQRLSQVRPETLGQASRVPGVTPAAIAVLGAYLGRTSGLAPHTET
jgi:tRNA uridine 5-carboxymethylaminomethyl modification enzyme